MHYLNHVSKSLQLFGPSRLISARPLERMIGRMKSNIKSKRNPTANCFNAVINNFAESCRSLEDSTEDFSVSIKVEYKYPDFRPVEDLVLANIVGVSQIRPINTYFPTIAGQTLRLPRSKSQTSIIFTTSSNDVHPNELLEGTVEKKYGILKLMYNNGTANCGLVEIISPVNISSYGVYFYDPTTSIRRWESIELANVITYGIEIKSIDERYPKRVNLVWRDF